MLIRKGNSVSWQEILAIGLAISSILVLLSYGMWPNAILGLTILNLTLWIISGVLYAFFGPKSKKFTLFSICLVYSILVAFLPGIAFTVIGIVIGTIMSIYIGKDLYQSPKEEK